MAAPCPAARGSDGAGAGPAGAGEVAGVEARLALREALLALPPGKRAVLALRYLEDLPEAQVADILGCSVGTVRSQTHKAIAQLRSVLPSLDPASTEVSK